MSSVPATVTMIRVVSVMVVRVAAMVVVPSVRTTLMVSPSAADVGRSAAVGYEWAIWERVREVAPDAGRG